METINPTNLNINVVPSTKEQIVAAAIGIGATLVVTGIMVGGLALASKLEERRSNKAAKAVATTTE